MPASTGLQTGEIVPVLSSNADLQRSKDDFQGKYQSLEKELSVAKKQHRELDQKYQSLKKRCTALERRQAEKKTKTPLDNGGDGTFKSQYEALRQQYEELQRTNALQAHEKTSQGPVNPEATTASITAALKAIDSHKVRRTTFVGLESHCELFVACSNEPDGQVKGCPFEIKLNDPDARSRITDILSAAVEYLPAPVKAITVFGKYMSSEVKYILEFFIHGRTFILGSQPVLDRYISSRINERGLKTIKNTWLITTADDEKARKKRKLCSEEEEKKRNEISVQKGDGTNNAREREDEDEEL